MGGWGDNLINVLLMKAILYFMRTIHKVSFDWYQMTLELYSYVFLNKLLLCKSIQSFIKDLNICSDLPANIRNGIIYYIYCALSQTISSLSIIIIS